MSEQISVDASNKLLTPQYELDIDIIASQTGIDDKLLIERTFMECNNDTARTILCLLHIAPKEPAKKELTDIDVFRQILDEKDKIYHDVMARKNK